MDLKKWVPSGILNIDALNEPYAIILLNRKICFKPTVFLKLWNNASARILVDGAANRWLKYVANNCLNDNIEPPHYLTGDLDSVTQQSIEKLENLGCETICTPDQSETDFTKSLLIMKPLLKQQNIKKVLTVMDFSGRIDHILSQINTLFKACDFLRGIDVYLMTKNCLSWLLCPGQHHIIIPEKFVNAQLWCSFIPVGSSTKVTTEGLKWNLSNKTVEFGGIVSSSNTYAQSNVRIRCDNCLFWSMATDYETANENDFD